MVDSKIRKQIIDLISQNFDASDLQGIYLAMGLDYDNLSSSGVQNRATELVEYLARLHHIPAPHNPRTIRLLRPSSRPGLGKVLTTGSLRDSSLRSE